MSVRYVLPNKHYIPVDMKYINVDNTSPYVPISRFGRKWNSVWGLNQWTEGTNPFWKCHLPRVVEQKLMGCATGVLSFLDRSLFLSSSVTPPSSVTSYPSRAWSTDTFPLSFLFSYFFSLPILHQTKRRSLHPSRRTKVREQECSRGCCGREIITAILTSFAVD